MLVPGVESPVGDDSIGVCALPPTLKLIVALFEIVSEQEVAVSALRHQREDDYH